MYFFFVLTPPSPSTLQHFLFQIFFNFSRLPFSFELTKKPFLSLDLVPKPTVAIFKDCVTSVATLCAVEMRNAIQGNDLKIIRKVRLYLNSNGSSFLSSLIYVHPRPNRMQQLEICFLSMRKQLPWYSSAVNSLQGFNLVLFCFIF